jgi:D-alanyl-D-alanine dipeptidase
MRILSLFLVISLLLASTACSNKPKPDSTDPSATQSNGLPVDTGYETEPPATTTARTYTLGTVTSLEDQYVYVRVDKSTASAIVGAAVLGASFEVLESGDDWCKIVYHEDQVGYIQTKCISQETVTAGLPLHHLYYYVPATEEIGPLETAFNNKLVVKLSTYTKPAPTTEDPNRVETLPCIDIYDTSDKLLAANATLVLKDATITAPILVDPFAPSVTPTVTPEPTVTSAPTDTPTLIPTLTPTVTSEPSPDAAAPEFLSATLPFQPLALTAATAESLTPSPTPVPIEIAVKNGVVTSAKGIVLAKDPEFEIGVDLGKVIAEDSTVITYMDYFLINATISITNGTIYSETGEINIESKYYFVPTLLKNNLVDVAQYSDGIKINLLLATDDNFLDMNVYGRPVCLLQKDTLDKLNQAQEKFQADGYSIIIYDAYRPYSVTVQLYDKFKDGTYVAGPRIGSVHNKGGAIDMSLVDKNGIPLEMPSPIHTLDSTSNRSNPNMTAEARENMEYMAKIMRSCGFSTIASEWWHFSDTDNRSFLRTDLDLMTVLQVVYPVD